MKIPKGFEVQIYEHCYGGRSFKYQGPKDIPSFPNFNDVVSSIEVKKIKDGGTTNICCAAMTKAC